MNIHILQHVPFEDVGCIRSWMETRQAKVTYTRFFKGDVLPEPEGLNLVIVLGGPMSVNDEEEFPWLQSEKQFIREAMRRAVPVLGICLGAQLIASAMGARVYKHAHREIGWFDVLATSSGPKAFQFPEKCLAFHWHGETFDLPPGAVRLAKSCGCENQAFQVGRNSIGLQFHLETTPESVQSLIENCRDELIPGPYIQTEVELQQIPAHVYSNVHTMMSHLLSYLTGVSD